MSLPRQKGNGNVIILVGFFSAGFLLLNSIMAGLQYTYIVFKRDERPEMEGDAIWMPNELLRFNLKALNSPVCSNCLSNFNSASHSCPNCGCSFYAQKMVNPFKIGTNHFERKYLSNLPNYISSDS